MCLWVVAGLAALVTEPEIIGPALGVRWGRIIIEGNTDTPDRVVLDCLDLRPGQRVRPGVFKQARERLRACPTLQANPWQGVPAVEFLPNELDSDFWDVRVRVADRPGTWLGYHAEHVFWSGVIAIVAPLPETFEMLYDSFSYLADRLRREAVNGR